MPGKLEGKVTNWLKDQGHIFGRRKKGSGANIRNKHFCEYPVQSTITLEEKHTWSWIGSIWYLCELLVDYWDIEGSAANGFQYFPDKTEESSFFLLGDYPTHFLMPNYQNKLSVRLNLVSTMFHWTLGSYGAYPV